MASETLDTSPDVRSVSSQSDKHRLPEVVQVSIGLDDLAVGRGRMPFELIDSSLLFFTSDDGERQILASRRLIGFPCSAFIPRAGKEDLGSCVEHFDRMNSRGETVASIEIRVGTPTERNLFCQASSLFLEKFLTRLLIFNAISRNDM
jgi:hypothetical protein